MRGILVSAMLGVLACSVIFASSGYHGPMKVEGDSLTRDEAIAAARTKSKPGSSFEIIREFSATDGTRLVGEQALRDARSQHIKLYSKGVLADVLTSGGFLVAEIDPETKNLIALHLVSSDRSGHPRTDTYRTNSVVTLSDATKLVQETASFADVLFSTPPSEAISLASRFVGDSFPECNGLVDYFPFAIPHAVSEIRAERGELREWAALYGEYTFWEYRFALSLPSFSANPTAALQEATKKQRALVAEFDSDKGRSPEFKFDSKYIDTVKSPQGLRERIIWLRRVDGFLEDAFNHEASPAVVAANRSIATIPLQVMGVSKDGSLYGAMTASRLVVGWQRLPSGDFAVKAISEAEAEDGK